MKPIHHNIQCAMQKTRRNASCGGVAPGNSAVNSFEPHAAVWVPQATLSEMSTRQNTRRLNALAPIARKDERPKAKKSCLRRLYSFRRHVCCRNPMAAALLAWWWRLGETLVVCKASDGMVSQNCHFKFQEAKTRLAPSPFSHLSIFGETYYR